jgi:hypothetical protein
VTSLRKLDDTRRDGWGLVIQIKQAVAEHARREASYRTRRGLEGRAIKGESAGGRAYGYRPASQSATGQVEIVETKAAVLEEAKRKHQDTAGLDALRAEEVLLRKMLRARTLSPGVAQAALDALANKRRKAASTVKMSPASLVQSFALTAERYREAVRNLGKHVTKSEHSTEERELVRAMLAGQGIVFSRDGRVGARFDWAGLAQINKTLTNPRVRIGSGGKI